MPEGVTSAMQEPQHGDRNTDLSAATAAKQLKSTKLRATEAGNNGQIGNLRVQHAEAQEPACGIECVLYSQ